MPAFVTWLLPVVLAAAGRMLGSLLSGPCPATADPWICAHWATIGTVGGAILGLFGVGVTHTARARTAALRVASEPTPHAPQREGETLDKPSDALIPPPNLGSRGGFQGQ